MTIEHQPTGHNAYGCNDELVYVVSDSVNVGQPKYRFIAEVYVDGVASAKLKCLPNSSNSGVFDVSRIVRDHAYPERDFNTTNYENDLEGARSVQVKFGYEYATSDSEVPSETLNQALSDAIVVTSGTYQAYGASYGDLFVNDFVVTAPFSPFLSIYNHENVDKIEVSDDDWGTLSVFRPDTTSSYDIGIRFKDANGGIVDDGNGNLYATIIGTGNALSDNGIAALGVYPENLRNNTNPIAGQTINPDEYDGWHSYELFHLVAGGHVLMKFERREPCDDKVRFAWWNSLGAWDFMNFYGKYKDVDEVERRTYRTYTGNSWTAGTTYIATPEEGVVSGGMTLVKRKRTINSNWLPESMTPVVADLFRSPLVFVQDGNVWHPIMLNSNSLQRKRRTTDNTFEYTFTFEYMNHIRSVG